jgi:hypothetical protein
MTRRQILRYTVSVTVGIDVDYPDPFTEPYTGSTGPWYRSASPGLGLRRLRTGIAPIPLRVTVPSRLNRAAEVLIHCPQFIFRTVYLPCAAKADADCAALASNPLRHRRPARPVTGGS